MGALDVVPVSLTRTAVQGIPLIDLNPLLASRLVFFLVSRPGSCSSTLVRTR
jgi:hypothetical protein